MATLTVKPGAGYWDLTYYPIGGCFRRAPRTGTETEAVETVEIVRLVETVWRKGERYVIGITADGRKIAVDDTLVDWTPSADESKPFPMEMEGPNHFDR